MDMDKLKDLYADPRHAILSEVIRVLDSQKVWNGQSYTYYPLRPELYRPLADKVSAEIDKIALEYGL